jgi:hypothetical protein
MDFGKYQMRFLGVVAMYPSVTRLVYVVGAPERHVEEPRFAEASAEAAEP